MEIKLNYVIKKLEKLDDNFFDKLEDINPKSHEELALTVKSHLDELRLLVKELKIVKKVLIK